MKPKQFLIYCAFALFQSLSAFSQQVSHNDILENSPQKNLRIAQKLADQNEAASALHHVNAVLVRQPFNRQAILLRAAIYSNIKSFNKALTDYNALLELEPENKEAVYARGVTRYNLDQFRLAIEDFELAAKLPQTETNTAYFKVDPVNHLATGVSTISKMDGEIMNYIGMCYLALQEYDNALKSFGEGIQLAPEIDDLYNNRALTYEALGNVAMAIEDYELVISRNPSNTIAKFNLLNLRGSQESDKLLSSLSKFIEENPDNAHGYASRGLHYLEIESYELALPDLKKANEMNADNKEFLFNLGLCHQRLGDLEQAEICFLQVIELEETHSAAYFNLGNIKFKAELYEEAIALYTMANIYHPEHAGVLYNRALAYFEAGMLTKACEDMQHATNLQPEMESGFYSKYCEQADQ